MLPTSFVLQNPKLHYQTDAATLAKQTITLGQGNIANSGALAVSTGKFTGRCPEDKFYVQDEVTKDIIDWGGFNHPIDEGRFIGLRTKIIEHLNQQKEIWIKDVVACADPLYAMPIRVYTELPWAALFVHNMFIPENGNKSDKASWTIFHAPHFNADPTIDGTKSANFSIISFQHQEIIIGGTGYTGEIKKGVFSVLNFLLPQSHQVLSMHCSANKGKENDVALFFGLSGTGKTTLSADPNRYLIGDDEHGWGNHGIFNFEGGCYAKTIHLHQNTEPDIYAAIKQGALLENIVFEKNSNKVNYDDDSITENTRVSYPISHIKNSVSPSIAGHPNHIFFLTCDAYGVLPPISKLSTAQAMYQFISGYTAKIAGTEMGIKAPKATFSACFGAPFFPLHPGAYAKLLGEKLASLHTEVWLINTGWTGGAYGVGKRIDLKSTRIMINAVLEGKLRDVEFNHFDIFNFQIPKSIPGIDNAILHPKNTWQNKNDYDTQLQSLALMFKENFKKFEKGTEAPIIQAGPSLRIN